MPVLRNILRNRNSFRDCTEEDVIPHFEKIKHWIPEGEWPAFQSRMVEAIKERKAFCTPNTFLYYTKEDARMAHGIALFGAEHQIELLSLFVGVFTHADTDTCLLRFKLHPGKFLEEYRTLLTTTSIHRTHRDPNHPLLVRVNDLRTKWFKLMEDGGVLKR